MKQLMDKLFNFMIGGDMNDKDEYQQQEIYKLMAKGYVSLYWGVWLMLQILLIWDIYWYGYLTLATYGVGIIFIINNFIVTKKLDKNKMLYREYESVQDYQMGLKNLKYKCAFSGLIFGTIMTFFNISSRNIIGEVISMKRMLVFGSVGVLVGIFFGVMMYMMCKKYFRLIEEELV